MCKSKKVCKCGVSKSVLLREGMSSPKSMSVGLQYHIDTGKPLNNTIYVEGSKTYNNLFIEARKYYSRGLLEVKDKKDISLLKDKNFGYVNEQLTKSQVEYKGRKYWVEYSKEDKNAFAYLDKELKNVAKINGKTLMFPTKHIEDKLIKENVEELWQVIFRDDDGNEVPYTDETFNSKIEAGKWAENQEWGESVEVYQDGDYRFVDKYLFHNPQDKENYIDYEIIPFQNLQENRINKLIREKLLSNMKKSELKKIIKEELSSKELIKEYSFKINPQLGVDGYIDSKNIDQILSQLGPAIGSPHSNWKIKLESEDYKAIIKLIAQYVTEKNPELLGNNNLLSDYNLFA